MKKIPIFNRPKTTLPLMGTVTSWGRTPVGSLTMSESYHDHLAAWIVDRCEKSMDAALKLEFTVEGSAEKGEIMEGIIQTCPDRPVVSGSMEGTLGSECLMSIGGDEIEFPVSKVTTTLSEKERTMAKEEVKLVDEVFDRIVDAVSRLMFGEEELTNSSYRNLIRIALTDRGIPGQLRRLHDDAEIRGGKKT